MSGTQRSVTRSLWSLLAEHLPPVEHEAVRRVLGCSLLDENEALFCEASALEDMLSALETQLDSDWAATPPLAPSAQRRLVEEDIVHLLQSLRGSDLTRTGTHPGGDVPSIPQTTPADKAVLAYISRPGTASSSGRSGTRPFSASTSGRPSTAGSGFDPSSTAAAMSRSGKLNAYDVDALADSLRSAFIDERQELLADIEMLQERLECVANSEAQSSLPPPDLHELQHYRGRLRDAVCSQEELQEHQARVNLMFETADRHSGSVARMRGLVAVSRSKIPALSRAV